MVDPLAGLAFAAGVTSKLKLGTTMTVTGRNPIRMAKELATIDRLSNGRLLLVFVPGLTDRFEDQALGVPVAERGAWIDEVLPLVRRLWSEDEVSHKGPRLCYQDLTPAPAAAAGSAGSLAGRHRAQRAAPRRTSVRRLAAQPVHARGSRRGPRGHRGRRGGSRARRRPRALRHQPGLRPRGRSPPPRPRASPNAGQGSIRPTLIPVGMTGLREMLERYIDVGFSKFVLRPGDTPPVVARRARRAGRGRAVAADLSLTPARISGARGRPGSSGRRG